MATAQQIADTRFEVNDLDANHYAFTDVEVGDIYDSEGSVLRAAHHLWGIIAGSGEKLQKIFQIDVTDGYSLSIATLICERRIDDLVKAIVAEEPGEYLYQDSDDRWTWDWTDHLDDMIA